MEMVAKSEPDGYTLLMTSAVIAINPVTLLPDLAWYQHQRGGVGGQFVRYNNS